MHFYNDHRLFKPFNSFDNLISNMAEAQKQFFQEIAEIKDNYHSLIKHYDEEARNLIKVLKETAFLCSLMFNIEDEKTICLNVINIINKIIQKPLLVRVLCASNSNTKLEVIAEKKFSENEIETNCTKTPLNCIAIRTCQTMALLSGENSAIPCPEMMDLCHKYSYICSPLIAEGVAYGCINILFEHTNDTRPIENNLDIINILAGYASLAIHTNRLIKTVKREALTDKLTGLPNRRYGMEALQHEIYRSKRYDHVFSVAMVDIDHFKAVNDDYGHTEGDRVLTLMSDLAHRCLRNVDLVSRFGGEEFLIILPETNIEKATVVIERFCKMFNEISFSDVLNVNNLTLSAGISQYPSDGEDSHSLIKVADERLYIAKNSGRNRVIARN